MATPKISTYEFIGWDGRITLASRPFREVTRPGVNGSGIIFDAWRTSIATITTSTVADDTQTRDRLIDSYRGLIGKNVAVTEPTGRTYDKALIIDAVPIWHQTLITDQWLITTTWKLLTSATAPTPTK